MVDRMADEALYRQAERHIEQLIRDRRLVPGDRIPSVAKLAAELGVNTLTAHRAVRELVQRQVLISFQGRGTFVAPTAAPRVLYVCGLEFAHDISHYYSDLLRFTIECCEGHGLTVEPVWVPNDRPHEAQRYIRQGENRHYTGYIFVGCDPDHPLLEHAIATRLPHVVLGASESAHTFSSMIDKAQAAVLAMEHLRSRGHRRITWVRQRGTQPALADVEVRERFGIEVEFWEPQQDLRQRSTLEHAGFELAHTAMSERRLRGGYYITDDNLARGFTRAATLRGSDAAAELDLVISCYREQVYPLGVPVTCVVYEAREQVVQGVAILIGQIQSQADAPRKHVCSHYLVSCDAASSEALAINPVRTKESIHV